MDGRKRTVQIKFRVTEAERDLILEKMKLIPTRNIRAGVFVLRKLFERYQDTNMVLMAYNMGEDGATRLWEKGIYSTDYTEKILNYQIQFNEQLEGSN